MSKQKRKNVAAVKQQNIAVKRTERNSSFEILRIIAMLMIIGHHFSWYGGATGVDFSEGINRYAAQVQFIGGSLGVDIFFIISGYFLAEGRFRLQKLLKLDFTMILYLVTGGLIATFALHSPQNTVMWVKSFFPITTESYWFITVYAVMYVLSPLFNRALNQLDKKHFTAFIGIMFFVVCVVPVIFMPMKIKVFNHNFLMAIYGYFIGAYLRKYPIRFMDNVLVPLLMFLASYALLSYVSIMGAKYGNVQKFANMSDLLLEHESILMIICSVSALMLFKNIKIGTVKAINIISQTTLGVYIIHELPMFRSYIWNHILNTQSVIHGDTYIISSLRIIFTVFIGCAVIDLIRIYLIENNISKIHAFDKFFNKINNFMNGV